MPRVLIVDDDQAIREVLHEIVTLYGYDCETAQSAKEDRHQRHYHKTI